MQPIVLLSRERNACAAECGSKRSRFTARMMRACNSGLMCGSPFMTRLTLLTDTPAWAATSRIVARAGWGWRNDIAGQVQVCERACEVGMGIVAREQQQVLHALPAHRGDECRFAVLLV